MLNSSPTILTSHEISSWYLISVASPKILMTKINQPNDLTHLSMQRQPFLLPNPRGLSLKPLQRSSAKGHPPASPSTSLCTYQWMDSPRLPALTYYTRWLCHRENYFPRPCSKISIMTSLVLNIVMGCHCAGSTVFWYVQPLNNLLVKSLLNISHALEIFCFHRSVDRTKSRKKQ